MTTLNAPIRIKRGVGVPTQLRQGELAWDQANDVLYIGTGSEVNGYAPTVLPISGAAASAVAGLSDVDVTSLSDGDVLVYDLASQTWIAGAVAAASVAWADVTGKPSVFTPDTHTHAWGDITSGVPSTFAPSTHASSHATGGADAIAPSDIGAAASGHTHGSITNDGKIGSTAGLPVVTGSAGAVTTLALGTAGQVLRVNAAADGVEFGTTAGESVGWADVTDKPTTFAPSAHKASHATGGADALSPSDIGAIPSSEKGANLGVATLDAGGKLNTAQLPNLAITSFLGDAANEAAMLALTGQEGDWAIRTDSGAVWIITGATPSSIGSWTQLSYPAAPVASVNGETGTVVLDHTDVGAAASSHTHSASDITSGLATVATTGAYSDLSGTPTLGTAAAAATTDFVAASAASTFGLSLLDDADAAAARTTLSLGSAATSATSDFAAATHTHVANDITNLADVAKTGEYSSLVSIPSTFTPSAHNHTVTLEISGFIEAPEAKTYVLSPSIPAAITITNIKAQTGAGTCDLKLQDDGSDIANTTLDDVGSGSVASPGTPPSASVAAGSKLSLVVSDPSSSAPEDLAFTVYYTVTSANNS